MRSLLMVSVLHLLTMGTVALGAESKPVLGSVQFWSRECRAAGQCDLPTALSEKLPVAGEVAAPTRPGQAPQFAVHLVQGDLSVDLQVLWPSPPNGSTPYLVAQALLKQGDGVPVVECTQYHSQDVAKFFPVGACAGFVPKAEGGYLELGATFYKE